MIRRALPMLVLVLLAVGSAWLLREVEVGPPSTSAKLAHVPDYYMRDFVTTTMGPTGKPRRRLEADYLEHFPDTGTSELQEPYLIVYKGARPPWHVRSRRGSVSPDGNVILLTGPVHIWRDDAQGQRTVDLHTRDVRWVANASYGQTDKPVLIRTPTSETTGVGMKAWLEQDRIQVLSRVHTHYVATKEQPADEPAPN